MDVNFDYVLAREAQLMFKRAPGFEPINGDLKRWKGKVRGGDNNWIEVEIVIPETFPNEPPIVKVLTPVEHSYVDSSTGRVNLRILSEWRPEYHVYQVVNSLKGLFVRIPPKIVKTAPPVTPPSEDVELLRQRIRHLEDQVRQLQRMLHEKDEEIARLRGLIAVHNVPEKETEVKTILLPSDEKERKTLELESEKIAVEDLIKSLNEKFESGDIQPSDYYKLYKRYRKELYLINKKLEELRKGE